MQGYGVSVLLRGWYCLPEYTSALRFSFRPLTGMVLIPFYVDEVLPGLSPPYGDGTLYVVSAANFAK